VGQGLSRWDKWHRSSHAVKTLRQQDPDSDGGRFQKAWPRRWGPQASARRDPKHVDNECSKPRAKKVHDREATWRRSFPTVDRETKAAPPRSSPTQCRERLHSAVAKQLGPKVGYAQGFTLRCYFHESATCPAVGQVRNWCSQDKKDPHSACLRSIFRHATQAQLRANSLVTPNAAAITPAREQSKIAGY